MSSQHMQQHILSSTALLAPVAAYCMRQYALRLSIAVCG